MQKGAFCGLKNTPKCVSGRPDPTGEDTTLPRHPTWWLPGEGTPSPHPILLGASIPLRRLDLVGHCPLPVVNYSTKGGGSLFPGETAT